MDRMDPRETGAAFSGLRRNLATRAAKEPCAAGGRPGEAKCIRFSSRLRPALGNLPFAYCVIIPFEPYERNAAISACQP